ncbi:Sugar phosphate permease [Flavobacteriaceae bacterium MAR_2010_188]|nr:Sugar phosphate permease [Flavobacteriaceae bacterium MAR_2010_188]
MLKAKTEQPLYLILILILAGEAVFILPFVLARIFRPTFLNVFNIDNFELGICFSVYGVVAMISYLFGGALADKFHPKNLMSLALILTGLGGFYMATFPVGNSLKILFGYWGFTTIFLFWSAMIKATRIWGGETMQGKAFGFLDGGRGIVAATFGVIGVFIFSLFTNSDLAESDLEERTQAFRYVIIITSTLVILIGIIVFLFLKELKSSNFKEYDKSLITLAGFKTVIKIRSVWLLMVIIMSAYVGYKLTDDISLYANKVMGFNEIESANIGTLMLFLRPVVGISIGFLADRSKASLWIIIGFIISILSSAVFTSGFIINGEIILFFLSVILMGIGVYAARVLYFAVLKEGNIPLALTGTAVGVISLVGYTPDIFVGPIMGYFLDENPGIVGHQMVFAFLGVFSIIGLIASIVFYRVAKFENYKALIS